MDQLDEPKLPVWRLTSQQRGPQMTWKLVMDVAKDEAGAIDLAADSVRLYWLSRWRRIPVPQEAQPLRVTHAEAQAIHSRGLGFGR